MVGLNEEHNEDVDVDKTTELTQSLVGKCKNWDARRKLKPYFRSTRSNMQINDRRSREPCSSTNSEKDEEIAESDEDKESKEKESLLVSTFAEAVPSDAEVWIVHL